MVHEFITKQAPPYLCDLFHDTFSVSGRNARNMSQLNLPKCRLTTDQRSFAFRGAKEYNPLLEDIRNINNIPSFIRSVAHFVGNSTYVDRNKSFNLYINSCEYFFRNTCKYFLSHCNLLLYICYHCLLRHNSPV